MIQMMHSFRGFVAPPDVLEGVRRGEIGAFCLFAYNFESLTQLRELVSSLHEAAREGGQPPPLVGIDQEGGQLMAVTGGATELPGNLALGATRSPELAERAGRLLAREMLALGINLNFAPVLDINNNPANPGIGTRSFGASPELVSEMGRAIIRGMQSECMVATVKHFPGHGDIVADTHYAMPTISYPMDYMWAMELKPFQDAIQEGVGAVMSGHVVFTALDDQQPATLSRRVMTDLLRGEMGYDGLVMTDAMDMHAVAQFGTVPSVEGALRAGVDLALLGHIPNQIALGEQVAYLLNLESAARIYRVRQSLPREMLPFEIIGSAEHQALAQEIADKAVTLVRGQLPLNPTADAKIVVITVQPANLTPADTSSNVQVKLAAAVQQRHSQTRALEIPMNASDAAVQTVLEAAQGADIIIVGTHGADRDPSQAALVKALYERGQNPVVVALRTPYDLSVFPMVETYLCSYSVRAAACEAAARALFGEINPTGLLPCPIPGIADVP